MNSKKHSVFKKHSFVLHFVKSHNVIGFFLFLLSSFNISYFLLMSYFSLQGVVRDSINICTLDNSRCWFLSLRCMWNFFNDTSTGVTYFDLVVFFQSKDFRFSELLHLSKIYWESHFSFRILLFDFCHSCNTVQIVWLNVSIGLLSINHCRPLFSKLRG